MELDRDGKLARWAYCLSDNFYHEDDYSGKVPHQTSLCALFWRAFVGVPLLFALIIVLVSAVLILVVGGIILHWLIVLKVIGVLLVAAVLILAATFVVDHLDDYRGSEPSVFFEGLKAVKGKVCPIVKFTSTKDRSWPPMPGESN